MNLESIQEEEENKIDYSATENNNIANLKTLA